MKKISFILILLLTGICNVFAQDDHAKREKMFKEVREFKMKYLAQEMDLNEAQKKKFFEIYEEMDRSRQSCYREAIKMDRKLKQDKDASEADYQKVTEAYNKANTEWSEKEKLYNEKLSEFLSQKQIYEMREAENSFRAKLDEMRHNKKKDHPKRKDEKR